MRVAIVKDGIVKNKIVVSDLSFPVGDDQQIISAELVDGNPVAEIGWQEQEDGSFAPPEASE